MNKSSRKQVCQISNTSSSMNRICVSREHGGSNSANIRLDEDVLKMSWRRLSSSSWEDVLKTSWRRLEQNKYVRLSLTSSEDVFKTSWSRPIYSSWLYVFKTSSRRLQDIFKTSSRHLQDVLKMSSRPLQGVFKTSSRRFEDVFKMSSRHLQDVLQRYLQDVFKTYHQVKLFLLTRLWEAFNTFLRRSFPKTVIYRGICLGNTTSDKFMVSVQNLQER